MKAFLTVLLLSFLAACTEQTPIEPAWTPMLTPANQANWQAVGITEQESIEWLGDNTLRLSFGHELQATRFTGKLPTLPYELKFQSRPIDGADFFCGLTFPVRSEQECLTFIMNGWGGAVTGLSNISGKDASDNETTSLHNYAVGEWQTVHLTITAERITATLNDESIIDLDICDKKLSLRPGPIEECGPFGYATFTCTGEIRDLAWRSLDSPATRP